MSAEQTYFTFDTTHHALWAEEVAASHSIPSEIVPAPARAAARCNLALITLPEDLEHLQHVLSEEAVPYQLYVGAEG